MPVHWNTTYAEAIDAWVEQLDKGLTGQKKAAPAQKKNKLTLTPQDWEMLESIHEVLKELNSVTEQLSRATVLTLPMLLPLYKHLQQHFIKSQKAFTGHDQAPLHAACDAALSKLNKHLNIALKMKLPLLSAVLHPAIRVCYFENSDLWEPKVAVHAQQLLEDTYTEYAEAVKTAQSNLPHQLTSQKPQASRSSVFAAAIGSGKVAATESPELTCQCPSKLDVYCSNAYPCTDENGTLPWWKVHVQRSLLCGSSLI
ncbi:hypothetical protein K466DRAFT_579417 [Polyporus arcularius HHB13444]|uniref:Uncharacterized protein n=1 Tax=Polyporus arcularius HHB13444 TaxID=1314778 RepID=A0A5C3NL69_9APHY|nr:hypothetical protein K466DRAFT_579417 [Polyporus arcularius HHB13444]